LTRSRSTDDPVDVIASLIAFARSHTGMTTALVLAALCLAMIASAALDIKIGRR
jgi:hypothetical protein